MSKTLEAEIVQISAYVQARELIARAVCRAYPPCICDTGQPCHAGVIYRREAEAVLSALTKAGLLALNGANLIKAIQDALGTEEQGENLVAVARDAHQAELELAALSKDVDSGASP